MTKLAAAARPLRKPALLAVAALVLGGWLNEALVVRTWEIDGVPRALKARIEHVLTAAGPLDFVHASPFRLRRLLLERIPDLADVRITRRLPHHLRIAAVLRRPVALWHDERGHLWLVDGAANPYRRLRRGEYPDLPLLRLPAADLTPALALLRLLKRRDGNLYAQLSEWNADADTWRLDFEHGRSWLLPRGEAAQLRLRRLLALMQKKRWRRGPWRIDARLPGRWYIRKSKPGGVV